jgi:NADH-quinone oxidoreductase subunit J
MIDQITFYVIAAIMLIFSVMAVTSRRILRAAVSMLFVLIGTAILFYMLKYDFLAAVQLTVYAGGVVVLIIFSIVLTHQSGEKLIKQSFKQILISAIIALTGAVLAIFVLLNNTFVKTGEAAIDSSVQNIGRQLLSNDKFGYAFPFEVVSVLLLAALVGSIIIAIKPSKTDSVSLKEKGKEFPVSNKNN